MFPLQEVNFHLSTDEVIFSQICQLHDGTFTATVSAPYKYNAIPVTKFFSWLPCPSNASAEVAFNEVFLYTQKYCAKYVNANVVKVNNPCNCEFVTEDKQKNIIGASVQITINQPI